MDKQNVVFPSMEQYLAIKRNGVLIHATTQVNLEYIMLPERTHSIKTAYCMIPFIGKSIDGKQINGFQWLEEGEEFGVT